MEKDDRINLSKQDSKQAKSSKTPRFIFRKYRPKRILQNSLKNDNRKQS